MLDLPLEDFIGETMNFHTAKILNLMFSCSRQNISKYIRKLKLVHGAHSVPGEASHKDLLLGRRKLNWYFPSKNGPIFLM